MQNANSFVAEYSRVARLRSFSVPIQPAKSGTLSRERFFYPVDVFGGLSYFDWGAADSRSVPYRCGSNFYVALPSLSVSLPYFGALFPSVAPFNPAFIVYLLWSVFSRARHFGNL